MSDQVIRYETEEEFLNYRNQREALCQGSPIDLPDFGKDPDSYWKAYYEYQYSHPSCHIRMRTWLLKEQIKKGQLIRQRCEYENVVFDTADEMRASDIYVNEHILPDPSVVASAELKTLHGAEKMRCQLLQEEPGYYYAIKHRTRVAIITRKKI